MPRKRKSRKVGALSAKRTTPAIRKRAASSSLKRPRKRAKKEDVNEEDEAEDADDDRRLTDFCERSYRAKALPRGTSLGVYSTLDQNGKTSFAARQCITVRQEILTHVRNRQRKLRSVRRAHTASGIANADAEHRLDEFATRLDTIESKTLTQERSRFGSEPSASDYDWNQFDVELYELTLDLEQ